MDMDNASWAMDQLRAANEENETSRYLVGSCSAPYVSQFRIDGQPILPPLHKTHTHTHSQMTADRRRQMLQLKQRALELEALYREKSKQPPSESATTAAEESDDESSSMSTVQRCLPQLQQTQTFIYDSTQQTQPQPQPQSQESPRSRPQTLHINSAANIPSICVNPPTPLEPQQLQPQLELSPNGSCYRLLGTTRRKLNNITSRIMRFERQAGESQPLHVLWQDKRMLRSSTSPALLLPPANAAAADAADAAAAAGCAAPDGQQMQRSRSFTLDEPSPALLAHLQRVGHKELPNLTALHPQAEAAAATMPATTTPAVATASCSAPRCRFAASSCSSAQSLAHLRRDTVESKAKQVQRSASSSQVESCRSLSAAPGRRCGGHNAHSQRTLQQQQLQLKQLLQRALHEADDVLDGQDQQERKQLTLAKRQMFKDIQLAHRDRFQQLVQYQHEEQRRMQAEFDRQQRFLIDQICADINISAYAGNNEANCPALAVGAGAAVGGSGGSGGVSEYTSTDDLLEAPTSHNDTMTLSPRESILFTARKRLFDGAATATGAGTGADTESDVPSEMLPLDSTPRSQATSHSSNNGSSQRGKLRKPLQQRSQSSARKQQLSPVTPHPAAKTTPPPPRRVLNNKPASATAGRAKPQQQPHQPQQKTLAKTRRSASPSRQSQRFVAKK